VVDLLAIIAVIVLLATVQISALASAKNQTKIAQCAANLRRLTLASHIYANENGDKLPQGTSGYWIWDLDGQACAAMLDGNKLTFQKFCYCPGTSPRFSDSDNLRLWWWASGGVPGTGTPIFRELGYAFTLKGTAALITTNQNETIIPKPTQFGPSVLPARPVNEVVLAADATLSLQAQHDTAAKYTGNYNYTTISGGAYPKPYVSAHLNGNIPAGGNLGMLDGHTEWRKFDDMIVRGYGGVGGAQDNGTCPTFWW
jgi:hypothetical protein